MWPFRRSDRGGPSEPDPRAALYQLLEQAVSEGVFPGCVALVWRDGATLYHEAHGYLASDPRVPEHVRPAARETVYDLASLTKVLATTTLTARALLAGRVALDAPVPSPWARACPGARLEHLLTHSAGLVAHREYFVDCPIGQAEQLLAAVCATPPAYPVGSQAIYSDLGFMILGAWLERLYDKPLDALLVDEIAWPLGLTGGAVPRLGYHRLLPGGARGPSRAQRDLVAPTELYEPSLHEVPPSYFAIREGPRYAHYEVHDDNALAMGGVAGHAGLFGDAEAALEVAKAWLTGHVLEITDELRTRFWTRSSAPGSSRCLGFDGVSPGGVTGDALSPAAVGHTGYTGTSLWIDPADASIYVLLSNRVHPTRENPKIQGLRPRFHQLARRLG